MTSRSMSSALGADEDDRPRRRDRACIASGLVIGAGLGAVAGAFARPSAVLLTVVGTLAGGLIGRLVASHISAEEWDPRPNARSHVGASSPDDDIAS